MTSGKVLLTMILAFGGLSSAEALVPPQRTCVLTIERPEHPIGQGVVDTFANYLRATVVMNAKPLDLVTCVENGYDEIIIIAHAFAFQGMKSASGKPVVRMGYFRTTEQGHEVGFFLDHVFKRAEETLAAQEVTQSKKLQRIRFMVCDPKVIMSHYPSFAYLLNRHSIALDVAPTSGFLSLFEDIPVAGMDVAWLAQSIDRFSLRSWATENNRNCQQDYWPGCDRRSASIVRAAR